jgi:hypothetical protein
MKGMTFAPYCKFPCETGVEDEIATNRFISIQVPHIGFDAQYQRGVDEGICSANPFESDFYFFWDYFCQNHQYHNSRDPYSLENEKKWLDIYTTGGFCSAGDAESSFYQVINDNVGTTDYIHAINEDDHAKTFDSYVSKMYSNGHVSFNSCLGRDYARINTKDRTLDFIYDKWFPTIYSSFYYSNSIYPMSEDAMVSPSAYEALPRAEPHKWLQFVLAQGHNVNNAMCVKGLGHRSVGQAKCCSNRYHLYDADQDSCVEKCNYDPTQPCYQWEEKTCIAAVARGGYGHKKMCPPFSISMNPMEAVDHYHGNVCASESMDNPCMNVETGECVSYHLHHSSNNGICPRGFQKANPDFYVSTNPGEAKTCNNNGKPLGLYTCGGDGFICTFSDYAQALDTTKYCLPTDEGLKTEYVIPSEPTAELPMKPSPQSREFEDCLTTCSESVDFSNLTFDKFMACKEAPSFGKPSMQNGEQISFDDCVKNLMSTSDPFSGGSDDSMDNFLLNGNCLINCVYDDESF